MRLLWLFLCIVLVVGGWYLYGRYGFLLDGNSDIESTASVVKSTVVGVSPPTELGDPTKVAPIFGVLEIGVNDDWSLEYLWPKGKAGQKISSNVGCDMWGNSIYDSKSILPRVVTFDTLVRTIASMGSEKVMFRGKCINNDCTMINGRCDLILIGGR